jgi:molybdopterin converting factor small subunit
MGRSDRSIATLTPTQEPEEVGCVARLRLFAGARDAAGTGRDDVPGATVADVLRTATDRYGAAFADVLPHCQIWVNGEPCDLSALLVDSDEVAVLPPVSGGAG